MINDKIDKAVNKPFKSLLSKYHHKQTSKYGRTRSKRFFSTVCTFFSIRWILFKKFFKTFVKKTSCVTML